MEYSVVIPVRDEAVSLGLLHMRLLAAMRRVQGESEIIYVDDASQDASAHILDGFRREGNPSVRVVHLPAACGQSRALAAGFAASKAEWIITLDADLQNPPEEIPMMVAALDGVDAVAGVRSHRKDQWLKQAASCVAAAARRVFLGDTSADSGCSLRVFRRSAAAQLPANVNFHRFLPLLFRESGLTVKEVAVSHEPRRFGVSHYGILRRGLEGIRDMARVRVFIRGLRRGARA